MTSCALCLAPCAVEAFGAYDEVFGLEETVALELSSDTLMPLVDEVVVFA